MRFKGFSCLFTIHFSAFKTHSKYLLTRKRLVHQFHIAFVTWNMTCDTRHIRSQKKKQLIIIIIISEPQQMLG